MIKPYYEENGITIYHGDCWEILPKLNADAVITDPPYLEGDFSGLLDTMIQVGRTVLTPGKQESFNWIQRRKPLWEYAWKCSGTSSLGGAFCFHILFEPILAYSLPIKPLGSDLLDFPLVVDHRANGHPWPKPFNLFSKLVIHWSKEGETVVDPFMGSGTTILAAKELGRKAIGIEIEEKYCKIAVERLAQGVLDFAS